MHALPFAHTHVLKWVHEWKQPQQPSINFTSALNLDHLPLQQATHILKRKQKHISKFQIISISKHLCFFIEFIFFLKSVAAVKHLSWSGKWSASTGMMHDNSVKRRERIIGKLRPVYTSHLCSGRASRQCAESCTPVTDDHQSILVWLGVSREG